MHFLYAALAVLLPLAAADEHRQCECHSWSSELGWHRNDQLTHYTCKLDYQGDANWDSWSHRCISLSHHRFDGDRFEGDCKTNGVNGFHPIGDDNIIDEGAPKIYTGNAVYGYCPE